MTRFRNQVYYFLKPSIPLSVRLYLRTWLARRKRSKCARNWPVRAGSETAPQGWPGWPESKQFSFVLTHDVESQTGVDRVRQLAELEMSLGFRSSFNFVPEGDYIVSPDLRSWLTDRGFEVGVHDLHHDGKLYRSRDCFRKNASRINQHLQEWNAVGFRSAFMLHNLDWLPDLDVAYDTSTFDTDPFEPQPDGVNTIFPFWVQRPDGRGFVELPYTLVQDFSLFVILKEPTADIWKTKTDWIAGHRGMALLDVHPDYMCFGGGQPKRDEYRAGLYADFLSWVKTKHGGQYWHALPREVARFAAPARPERRVDGVAADLSVGSGPLQK